MIREIQKEFSTQLIANLEGYPATRKGSAVYWEEGSALHHVLVAEYSPCDMVRIQTNGAVYSASRRRPLPGWNFELTTIPSEVLDFAAWFASVIVARIHHDPALVAPPPHSLTRWEGKMIYDVHPYLWTVAAWALRDSKN